jgi:hypothetical protein
VRPTPALGSVAHPKTDPNPASEPHPTTRLFVAARLNRNHAHPADNPLAVP